MKESIETIVVGGGVIGLACAWRLAQLGVKVLLLDRGACGGGASSASLGVLAPHTLGQRGPFPRLHRQSLQMMPHFVEELEEASGINVQCKRCGALQVLEQEVHHAGALKELESANQPWEGIDTAGELTLLSKAEVSDLEPAVANANYGGLLRRSTAMLSVSRFVEALKLACLRQGVIIKEYAKVETIVIRGSKAAGVRCKGETLHAAHILAAAGAWTSELAEPLSVFAPIQPARGQALRIAVAKPLIRHIIKSERGYLVPESPEEIALGSTTELKAGFDEFNTAKGLNEILAKTTRAVPAIADARIKKIWAGLRPAGADRKLYLGAVPGVQGLSVAGGHYKIGFGFAPLTAQVMAEMLTGKILSFDVEFLKPRQAAPKS